MKMHSGERERKKVNILGVGISPTNMKDALHQMESWVETREQYYVCVCPNHTIMEMVCRWYGHVSSMDTPVLKEYMDQT